MATKTKRHSDAEVADLERMLKDYQDAWPDLRRAFQRIAHVCDGTLIDSEKVKLVRRIVTEQGIK